MLSPPGSAATSDPVDADRELQQWAIEILYDNPNKAKVVEYPHKGGITDSDLEDLEMFAEITLSTAAGEFRTSYPTPEAKAMFAPRQKEFLDIARHNAPIARRILTLLRVRKSGSTATPVAVHVESKAAASKPSRPKAKAKPKPSTTR
jgi:hypothetical protein